MKVTKYRVEKNDASHNVLVKEKSTLYPGDALHTPEAAVSMLEGLYGLSRMAEEYVYLLAFNTKCRPLGIFEVSHGSASCSLCSPREIFIRAMLCGATGIVLAHNHPSGDPVPSLTDMEVFKKVRDAGNIMDIPLLDNLIIGENGSYFSFKEQGFYD